MVVIVCPYCEGFNCVRQSTEEEYDEDSLDFVCENCDKHFDLIETDFKEIPTEREG